MILKISAVFNMVEKETGEVCSCVKREIEYHVDNSEKKETKKELYDALKSDVIKNTIDIFGVDSYSIEDMTTEEYKEYIEDEE